MKIEELAVSEGIWSTTANDASDIVLKSSIRFLRNIDGYLFTSKLGVKEKQKIEDAVIEALKRNEYIEDFTIHDLRTCSDCDHKILFERNILTNGRLQDGILILSNDQSYHFLLNGTEHIQLVIQRSGYQCEEIYVFGKKVMLSMENELDFAFSSSFGYLTSFPNNSGSGVELFLTVHLPGLVFSSKINEVIVAFEKQGIGVRSSWIDGYYEIFNKYSCRGSEKSIYENIVNWFQTVIMLERENRERTFKSNKSLVEDKVWRSYGILLSSRIMALHEALDLLSNIRLGISLGIIHYMTIKDVNLLVHFIQDYHLRKRYNINEGNTNIDELRAQFLRDYLKEVM
jgi:protein arginine kinase